MPELNFFILYVESPLASAGFYAELFGQAPVEAAPTFVLFALANGNKLGLWCHGSRRRAGGDSLQASVRRRRAVSVSALADQRGPQNALHQSWHGRGWSITQAPTEMDFGIVPLLPSRSGRQLGSRASADRTPP